MSDYLFLYEPAFGFRQYQCFEGLLFEGGLAEPIVPDFFGSGGGPPTVYLKRAIRPWPAVTMKSGRLIVRQDVMDQLRKSSNAQFAPVVVSRLIDHEFSGSDFDYRPFWGIPSTVFDAYPHLPDAQPSKFHCLRSVHTADRTTLGSGLRFSNRLLPKERRKAVPNATDVLDVSREDLERFGCLHLMGGYLFHPSIASVILPHVSNAPYFFYDVLKPTRR